MIRSKTIINVIKNKANSSRDYCSLLYYLSIRHKKYIYIHTYIYLCVPVHYIQNIQMGDRHQRRFFCCCQETTIAFVAVRSCACCIYKWFFISAYESVFELKPPTATCLSGSTFCICNWETGCTPCCGLFEPVIIKNNKCLLSIKSTQTQEPTKFWIYKSCLNSYVALTHIIAHFGNEHMFL